VILGLRLRLFFVSLHLEGLVLGLGFEDSCGFMLFCGFCVCRFLGLVLFLVVFDFGFWWVFLGWVLVCEIWFCVLIFWVWVFWVWVSVLGFDFGVFSLGFLVCGFGVWVVCFGLVIFW